MSVCVLAVFLCGTVYAYDLVFRAEFLMHRPLFLHAAQAVYVYEFANEEHQPMLELLFGRSETSLEALLSKLQQSDVSAPAEMQTPPATSDILSELDNRDGEALQLESAEETSEEWYTDKSDSLRRFTYGVEHFATYELSNLQYMTDYDGKTIVRRAYDDAMRLVQTETFPAPAEVTKLTRATVKTLRYQDSSLIPYESEFVDEKNAKRTVTTYDERSLPVSVARYHTQDEELLDETEKTAYDDKKRIMKKETVTWTYTKDSKNRVRAKTHSTC